MVESPQNVSNTFFFPLAETKTDHREALLASRRSVRPKEMLHCGVLQSLSDWIFRVGFSSCSQKN